MVLEQKNDVSYIEKLTIPISVRVNKGYYRNRISKCSTIVSLKDLGDWYFLKDIQCELSQPYFHESWVSVVDGNTYEDV